MVGIGVVVVVVDDVVDVVAEETETVVFGISKNQSCTRVKNNNNVRHLVKSGALSWVKKEFVWTWLLTWVRCG